MLAILSVTLLAVTPSGTLRFVVTDHGPVPASMICDLGPTVRYVDGDKDPMSAQPLLLHQLPRAGGADNPEKLSGGHTEGAAGTLYASYPNGRTFKQSNVATQEDETHAYQDMVDMTDCVVPRYLFASCIAPSATAFVTEGDETFLSFSLRAPNGQKTMSEGEASVKLSADAKDATFQLSDKATLLITASPTPSATLQQKGKPAEKCTAFSLNTLRLHQVFVGERRAENARRFLSVGGVLKPMSMLCESDEADELRGVAANEDPLRSASVTLFKVSEASGRESKEKLGAAKLLPGKNPLRVGRGKWVFTEDLNDVVDPFEMEHCPSVQELVACFDKSEAILVRRDEKLGLVTSVRRSAKAPEGNYSGEFISTPIGTQSVNGQTAHFTFQQEDTEGTLDIDFGDKPKGSFQIKDKKGEHGGKCLGLVVDAAELSRK